MDKSNTNSEYRTDYLDIVNEINDFIASLDAPPLDNHTKELVGTSDRPKFGHHGTDLPAFVLGHDESSSHSRHASGDNNVSNQLFVPKISDNIDYTSNNDETLYESSLPFPCAAETNPDFPIYENMDLDSSRSADGGEYSDLSNYGGAFSDSSSCGELADSDSGCYSQYQKLKSEGSLVDQGSPINDMLSTFSPVTASSSSLPNVLSGYTRGQDSPVSPGSSSSSSPRHHKQQHTRPQSPDRLSAEFLCDPDPLDLRFHQAGSSAHTLAASLGKYTSKDSRLAEPGICPKVPDSPVPKRKPPLSFLRPVESGTQHPLSISSNTHSSSLNPPAVSEHSQQSEQDVSYSVIKKPTPLTHPSHFLSQKQSIKSRWPPSVDKDKSSSSFVSSQLDNNTAITPLDKPSAPISRQNLQTQESVAEKSQLPTGAGSSSPRPVLHVPDLSLLISELRSASPRSELSPTSTYTSSARSESISPKPHRAPFENSTGQAREPQQQAKLSLGPTSRLKRSEDTETGAARSDQRKAETGHSPLDPRSDQEATGVSEPACLSKTAGLTNGCTHRSESPEHDYEPIENLQLEIPATPRPQPKFPHPQGQAMAETGGQQPKHVKALHNFKGKNNDELCFKKGDIITVTQCEDRDWWEGTLNGRTGWFPCNYTKEVKTDISFKNKPGDVPVLYKRESMQLYHNVVLKNIIETEKTHVTEMVRVLQSYIKPLESANILNTAEFKLLVGNMEEIIALQQSLLATLEDCEKQPSSHRKIGGIFMQFAPTVKELYSTYCANHPKAVSVLQKKREELGKFVESQGALSPGAQTLTTILSKPFTRLEKYPSLLKELERHVEESHPDRGDTQRAIAVYRNIANSCMEIRKLKEMEFEIITSTIQGWEGEDICKLGEVIHLSLVKMITQTGEKYERIFVLFSSCLVMLSMSARLSSYHYEGKIPLSGLTASPTESAEHFLNAFEISGPMIEKITVICGTKMEVVAWLDILNQQVSQSGNPVSATKPQPLQVHMISTGQTTVSAVTPAKTAQISHVTSNPPSAPPPHYPQVAKTSTVWGMSCLRPSPPVRPNLMCREEVLKSPRAGRKVANKRKPVRTYSGEETDWHSKNDPKVYNEDAFILQVIEAYCNSIKTRHTVNSSILNSPSPHVLLAEEEKVFDENEQQERTVVDTVYALQDRVKELEQEQRKLRQELEEEKRCRKKLEILVRAQVNKSNIVDGIQDGSS